MQTFATARDAKEFLANRIIAEAERENVPLSEIEQKMLYFSETHWAPPDALEVSEAFDREYDSGEYEEKIATLIRSLRKRDRKEDPDEYENWKNAVRTIKPKDHYLLVLIGVADGRLTTQGASDSSPLSFLQLLGITLAVSAVICVFVVLYMYFKDYRN